MNLDFRQELYEENLSSFKVFGRPFIKIVYMDMYLKEFSYGFDENILY